MIPVGSRPSSSGRFKCPLVIIQGVGAARRELTGLFLLSGPAALVLSVSSQPSVGRGSRNAPVLSEELAEGTGQIDGEQGGFAAPHSQHRGVYRWHRPEGFS